MNREILMIPGPTFLHPSVIEAMAQDSMSHVSSEFKQVFLEILDLTRYLFKCQKGQPFVFTGSGTVGMEAAITSLIEPGERVLAIDNGYFGRRFEMLAQLHGAQVEAIRLPEGHGANPKLVQERLEQGGFKALLITHVETSNSVMNEIEGICSIARKHSVLTFVDSICSVGGASLDFDALDADVAITASQKAIAAPSGATLLCLSRRALEQLELRKTPIPSYYFNLKRWRPIMDDPAIYLTTPSVHVMLALRQALRLIKEEGTENRWRRHELLGQAFRAGIEVMGLKFVAEPNARATTLTAFHAPDQKAGEIQKTLRERYRVHVARGLYENKDRYIRVAHFGNITAREIVEALGAIELTLKAMGYPVKPGSALEASAQHLKAVALPPF